MDDTDIEKMYTDSRFTKWQQKFIQDILLHVQFSG